MNSSDQAVMPLDTAFKRRWNFKYIPLDFDNSYTRRMAKPCSEWRFVHSKMKRLLGDTPQENNKLAGKTLQ